MGYSKLHKHRASFVGAFGQLVARRDWGATRHDGVWQDLCRAEQPVDRTFLQANTSAICCKPKIAKKVNAPHAQNAKKSNTKPG